MTIELVSWDFREGLLPQDLIAAIRRLPGGPIHAIAVDTGTDSYMVALSDRPVTQQEAIEAWQAQADS